MEGASNPVYLATAEELNNITGKYFVKKAEASSSLSYNMELRRKFWLMSEKLCEID
jgi:hypothetical protein